MRSKTEISGGRGGHVRRRRAFTLIELLIVVAIIAILAAIAVPNFLEAQQRSKVSRVKADLRSISVGLESYAVDHNKYPILRKYFNLKVGQYDRGGIDAVLDLTTPVAYLASVDLPDPFSPTKEHDQAGNAVTNRDWMAIAWSLGYVNIQFGRTLYAGSKNTVSQYCLLSLGPDLIRGPDPRGGSHVWGYGDYIFDPPFGGPHFDVWQYDPTNGTRSKGDVLMFHP